VFFSLAVSSNFNKLKTQSKPVAVVDMPVVLSAEKEKNVLVQNCSSADESLWLLLKG